MDEFIKLLKETYDNDKKIQEIENLLNTAKNKVSTHFLYLLILISEKSYMLD